MGTAGDPEERQFLCSACLQVVPESLVHVISYYKTAAGICNDHIRSVYNSQFRAALWLARP